VCGSGIRAVIGRRFRAVGIVVGRVRRGRHVRVVIVAAAAVGKTGTGVSTA